MKIYVIFALLVIASVASSQESIEAAKVGAFETSNCAGCHGRNGMGGLGPPLAKTKLPFEEFATITRKGKGMMPAVGTDDVPDDELKTIYSEVAAKGWMTEEIPIAYKVGQFLSPKNVSRIFLVAFGFFFIFAISGLTYWIRVSGLGRLMPAIRKLGYGRAFVIAARSLVVDGFLVGSLWKSNKKRWLMHGLMLYGFCGLILADILMAIYNPQRGQLPLGSPLKLLPILSGIALMVGIGYVMYRYKKDEFIDNGLTLGKDFLFLNLLAHTALSGFLVVLLKRLGVHDWVMTIYIYHLASIFMLVVTGPFTRMQHMYVVPVLAAITRLTEAVTESGVDIGFEREPTPGRHHKSQAIAEDVLAQLGPEHDGKATLRYYP